MLYAEKDINLFTVPFLATCRSIEAKVSEKIHSFLTYIFVVMLFIV